MKIHYSDRNIPLLYHEDIPEKGSILTVENYIKWYDIYVIGKSKVRKLPFKWNNQYEQEFEGEVAWSDHIPTPWFCKWLTKKFTWDYVSLEVILGRWILENHPQIQTDLFVGV